MTFSLVDISFDLRYSIENRRYEIKENCDHMQFKHLMLHLTNENEWHMFTTCLVS